MEYIPKQADKNVNVSKRSHVVEFGTLLLGSFLIILVLYVGLWIFSGLVVHFAPNKVDGLLASLFSVEKLGEGEKYAVEEAKLQSIVDQISKANPEIEKTPTVVIKESFMINAFAYPGNNIVVHTGLLEDVDSEQEIAMVLGHEVGHLHNRDHLRGFGRAIGLIFILSFFMSADSMSEGIFGNLIELGELRFSRNQELEADDFGLDALVDVYGHAAGATVFFDKLAEQELMPAFLEIASTHPNSKGRSERIKELIKERGYSVKDLLPYQFKEKD